MQLKTGRDLSESLFDVLGYCSNTERVRIGSLAENTHPQIKEEIHDMLTSGDLGFSEDEAHSVIEQSWSDTPENMRIKTTGDLQQIFSDLKVTYGLDLLSSMNYISSHFLNYYSRLLRS